MSSLKIVIFITIINTLTIFIFYLFLNYFKFTIIFTCIIIIIIIIITGQILNGISIKSEVTTTLKMLWYLYRFTIV